MNLNTQKRHPRAKRGISLIEVIVSMAVIGLLGVGYAASLIQSRRLAESAVYESTATAVAVGYMEQMKGMVYDDLADALSGGSANGIIPTVKEEGTSDPLTRGSRESRTIVIDTDEEGNPKIEMDMWLTANLENIQASSGLDAIEITLQYEWQPPDQDTIQSRTFKSVRANVMLQ